MCLFQVFVTDRYAAYCLSVVQVVSKVSTCKEFAARGILCMSLKIPTKLSSNLTSNDESHAYCIS
jgi:hypothetical protein